MFSLRSILTTSMLAVPMFLATGAASAAVVAGTSSGSFSNITGCNGDNCRLNNTGYGSNTQVEWGYRNGIFGNDGSTLTAVNRSFSQPTDADDLILAELVWVNLATPASVTPDDFNVRYTLKINFTSPNASNDTEAFDLVITNPTNSTGDNIQGMTMTDLSNLSFSLNGVMISDLKYKLGGGAGSNFNNNVWYNPENTTSRMFITADFKAVPEPASLGLLAAGLFGIGVMRRRKNA